MTIKYNAGDLRKKLIALHGAKLTFLFREFDRRKFEFKVEDLVARRFDGTKHGAYVDDGAPDLDTAASWALDALREWAGSGLSYNGNYFGEITRQWATDGEGSDNVPARIGTTIDWAYLFSGGSSANFNSDMYPIVQGDDPAPDLTNLICWVFTDHWEAISLSHVQPPIPMDSDRGLHLRWWDYAPTASVVPNKFDQTHHFAAYFWFGAHIGTGTTRMHVALKATSDYDMWEHKVINRGDYDLGFLGAHWGARMKRQHGYIGKDVERDLRSGVDSVPNE